MTKKRQKKGFAPEDTAGVSEATRIRISNLLEQFRASDDEGPFSFSIKIDLLCTKCHSGRDTLIV